MKNSRYGGGVRSTPTVFVLILLCIATAFLIQWNATRTPEYRCSTQQVVVEDGDTLDQIVLDNCHGERSEIVYLLVRMYGAIIQVGQVIHLPIQSG